MRTTTFDIETTIRPQIGWQKGTSLLGGDASPYLSDNSMVCLTYKCGDNTPKCIFFDTFESKQEWQQVLDNTDILIGFNIKFDLSWIKSCGFKYTGKIYDTMLGEYILSNHTVLYPSLEGTATKYGLGHKLDKVKEYWERGINTNEIPRDILSEYNIQDVALTYYIYVEQQKLIGTRQATIDMSNDFCHALTDIEMTGIAIDNMELQRLSDKTLKELEYTQVQLKLLASESIGEYPINLDSPEQLSALIYSRTLKDKKVWKDIFAFTPYENKFKREARLRKLKEAKFVAVVKNNTNILYKKEAIICPTCKGTGEIQKIKKDGSNWSKQSKCKECLSGTQYIDTDKVAGFKVTPKKEFVTVNGFSTDKDTISILLSGKVNSKAREFLTLLSQYNALTTYHRSFILGVQDNTIRGILHPSYRQVATATGRLSSTNPNIQNMPRGNTFPIKKVFTSRWQGGKVLDMDFSQLEFRVAVEMSRDEKGVQDIQDKVDVHALTAAALGISRQEAKSHTFAPLYGASKDWGLLARYPGIKVWQDSLIEEAIATGSISLPTGRTYSFPNIKRTSYGCNFNTTVKNYPVQGYATADIVPSVLIEIHKDLMEFKSKIIATIHDSILIDVHPEEIDIVKEILKKTLANIKTILYTRYKIDFKTPLTGEIKLGDNAYDMIKI